MSKIDGICTGNWSPFSFLCSKVGRVTGHLAIGFCGEATGCLAIEFHVEATSCLYCSFSGLILEAVL